MVATKTLWRMERAQVERRNILKMEEDRPNNDGDWSWGVCFGHPCMPDVYHYLHGQQSKSTSKYHHHLGLDLREIPVWAILVTS